MHRRRRFESRLDLAGISGTAKGEVYFRLFSNRGSLSILVQQDRFEFLKNHSLTRLTGWGGCGNFIARSSLDLSRANIWLTTPNYTVKGFYAYPS